MLTVHLENGRVEVRRAPWPRRRPGEALIRLVTAGICNTDLELQRGYYGFRGTPGHEFVGEVVEAEEQALLGRRVVGEINLACGRCEWCKRGLDRHCPRRTVLGIAGRPGVFSEYFTLPEANLHLVPDIVPDDHAVFAEPIAAACEILEQVRIPRGQPVAVLGDGKLGLLVAQVLHASRLEVHLYGKHREKLAIAAAVGIRSRLASPSADYDWVVEATGNAGGLKQAIAMTRPRGTVLLKSTVHGDVRMDTAPVVVNEITLVGSRCGRFEPALALLRKRKLRLDEMIAGRLPLSQAPRALRLAARKGALKVLLHPGRA
ncbi:MAG TPA: alcohol dehydrogenase catalytic domain-containing protein [Bryobacteraceae bacterium]|nr:alcohol dehydrogenase catalytic domain-containing protein [Bryobacteraceae bacterium]